MTRVGTWFTRAAITLGVLELLFVRYFQSGGPAVLLVNTTGRGNDVLNIVYARNHEPGRSV